VDVRQFTAPAEFSPGAGVDNARRSRIKQFCDAALSQPLNPVFIGNDY
jgi:hypothetical protein